MMQSGTHTIPANSLSDEHFARKESHKSLPRFDKSGNNGSPVNAKHNAAGMTHLANHKKSKKNKP